MTPADAKDAARRGRLAPWLGVPVGVLAALVGVVLLLDPFRSLAVLVVGVVVALVLLGLGDLAAAWRSGGRWWRWVTGAVWLAAAAAVLAWPGPTVRVLAFAAGAAAVLVGLRRLVAGLRGHDEQRVTAVLLGASATAAGVLLLAWPDITVFVVAVACGATLVVQGLARARDAVRPRARPERRSRGRRLARTGGAVASVLVVALLVSGTVALHRATPVPDAFYTPPATVPGQPGRLLRSEPFSRGMPAGTHAWRILYTTTRDAGVPAVASGFVLVGDQAVAGPRPVIAWAHGTTGFAQQCAPTLLADPLGAGAMPALGDVISHGWALVATDYVGLGTAGPHPYLVGQAEGRSVLDAVRAARQLAGVTLSDETVVWGHSQGGHAALWTAILQPGYAPDVPLRGVAALAPATDLPALVRNLDQLSVGSLFAAYAVAAYSQVYPDVRFDDVVRPGARVQVHEMADRCLSEPSIVVSVLNALLFRQTILARGALDGPFARRLAQNVPTGPITVPVLVAQGEADPLVLPAMQQAYVAARCADGWSIDYRTYPGLDHTGLVADSSPLVPQLVAWTVARFTGQPAASTCPGA